ncbi:MAG: MFS transporter [Rickettsiella sp.]|nr:MFS transporter [Rickettsiella sp.]
MKRSKMESQTKYDVIQRRTILSASIGTVLEWYDFTIYAYLAAIFATLFFPTSLKSVALIFSYAVFAIGYIARPLGALLFGHFGDTRGRKKTLTVTILLMAITTLAIGLLPNYETVGIIAPLLLVILRLLQGIAVGGEAFGSACFIVETIPQEKNGLFSSLIWSSSVVGMLLASLIVFITFMLFQGKLLYTVGWRLPFLLAALSGIVGYYIRTKTSESYVFQCLERDNLVERFPLKKILISHKLLIVQLVGLYLLSALITYLAFIFMPVYFSDVLGHSRIEANAINTVMLLLLMILDVFFGSLSDKVGRKPLMLTAASGFVLLSYPLYYFIAHGNLVTLMLGQTLFTVLAAGFQGPLMALSIDLIPTNIRYTLGSLGYNLAYSIFGGTAPLVAMFLIAKTSYLAIPGLYLAIGALIAVLSLLMVKKNSLLFN